MDNSANFFPRFWQYLKERFPLHSHGILIAAFSFSAIGYSRFSRDLPGFIELDKFLVCIFNMITLFLLLRIFDEHKDAEDDAKFRTELPVPRGLIRLSELRNVGIAVFIFQCILTWFTFPEMLPLYLGVILYLLLMGKEFFIKNWLKQHQFWYVTSHMLIIPFVDIYASGYDWYLDGTAAPFSLIFFFGVSFMNGIVLEVGRKIRAPHDEKPGVQTYSSMLGLSKSLLLWIAVLTGTLLLALCAAYYAHFPISVYIALCIYFVFTVIAAHSHAKHKSSKTAKWIEHASGLWAVLMYLTLGGFLKLMEWL